MITYTREHRLFMAMCMRTSAVRAHQPGHSEHKIIHGPAHAHIGCQSTPAWAQLSSLSSFIQLDRRLSDLSLIHPPTQLGTSVEPCMWRHGRREIGVKKQEVGVANELCIITVAHYSLIYKIILHHSPIVDSGVITIIMTR